LATSEMLIGKTTTREPPAAPESQVLGDRWQSNKRIWSEICV